MRGSSLTANRQSQLGITRGSLESSDDKHMMQTVNVRGYYNELLTDVERFQTYGHTSVPMPPSKNAKTGKMEAAEVLMFRHGGQASHTIVLGTDDRRFRQKNLKPGDVSTYHHTGANSTFSDKGYMHDMGPKKMPLSFSTGTGSIYVSKTNTAIQQDKAQVKLTGSEILSKLKDSSISQTGSKTTVKQNETTVVMDGTTITNKAGTATVTVQDGKITCNVGGTVVIVSAGRVDLGGEGGIPIMLSNMQPSTKVFAV